MPKRDFSRTDRVSSEMQRELSFLLQREVKDPRVGLTTVSTVRVSKDLQNANVYVTFLNRDSADKIAEAVAALNNMAGFLRSQLGSRMRLRIVPKLAFHYDEVQARGQRLHSLISSAVASDQARTPHDEQAHEELAHDDGEEE